MPCLDRILGGVTVPCELLAVYDDPADSTVPVPRAVRRQGPAGAAGAQRARHGPGARDPVGDRAVAGAGGGGHHGRRQRRSRADRPALQAGRPGRGDRRGVALHERRATDRWAAAEERTVTPGRSVALLVRAGRHARRDQLVQGVLHRLRARGGHRLRHRLRDRDRAGGEGAAAPAAGCRDPDHLVGARPGHVELQGRVLAAALPAVVPVRASGRSSASRICGCTRRRLAGDDS